MAASGGGGDGGATTPPTTTSAATQSASAASAATKSIINSLGVGSLGGGVGKPSAGLSDPAKIRLALAAYKSSLSKPRFKVTTIGPSNCSGGGTQTTTIDDKDTTTKNDDDSITIVADNCVATSGTLTITTNGTSKFEPTTTGSLISGLLTTFTNFSTREVDSSSGKVFESSFNGTLALSESGDLSDGFLTNATLTMTLTSSTKVDATGDGTFEVNESFTANNFILTIAESGPTPSPTTIGISGSMSVTDNVTPANDFSSSFSDFTMVLTPDTRDGVNGETFSINGTVAVTSACVTATFTLSTPSNALPFIPDDEECPVDGKIVVTGGEASSTVIFTSTAGARVQIDEGSNGTIDDTFTDCESAEVCA